VIDKLSLSFPREPDSVPAARAALDRFEGALPPSALYDASLCLSELVTNAVQHPSAESGRQLGLELTLSQETLRVEVIDPGGGFQPGPPTEGDERGWGLFIVDQLSTRWGTEPEPLKTVMWFEIDRGKEAVRAGESRQGGADESAVREPDGDDVTRSITRFRFDPPLRLEPILL
jgi:anti-sigma regulatory factor (Ser/Thr protein kinase)